MNIRRHRPPLNAALFTALTSSPTLDLQAVAFSDGSSSTTAIAAAQLSFVACPWPLRSVRAAATSPASFRNLHQTGTDPTPLRHSSNQVNMSSERKKEKKEKKQRRSIENRQGNWSGRADH